MKPTKKASQNEASNLKALPKRDLELSAKDSARVSGGARKAGGDSSSTRKQGLIIVVC